MRVGIPLLTLAPGEVGGSETLVRGLLQGLGADREDENRYTVVASDSASASLEPLEAGPLRVTRVERFRYGGGKARRLAAIARARYAGGRLAREIRRAAGEFDVVHTRSPCLFPSCPELGS